MKMKKILILSMAAFHHFYSRLKRQVPLIMSLPFPSPVPYGSWALA